MADLYSAVERNKKPAGSIEIPEDFRCYYLNKKDRQMRFNNAGDPIYAIFDKIGFWRKIFKGKDVLTMPNEIVNIRLLAPIKIDLTNGYIYE